jgi:hypothetical protein
LIEQSPPRDSSSWAGFVLGFIILPELADGHP